MARFWADLAYAVRQGTGTPRPLGGGDEYRYHNYRTYVVWYGMELYYRYMVHVIVWYDTPIWYETIYCDMVWLAQLWSPWCCRYATWRALRYAVTISVRC